VEYSDNNVLYKLIYGLVIWVFLIGLYYIYKPGIAPGFIFDDFHNLNLLGNLGTIDTWSEVINYILAGPSRRPISMASFLINDNAWPSAAESFKYTNVILHLGVTALFIWLVYLLMKIRGLKGLAPISIAILAAAFWALHPLHVSTVLYPVQRMAILSALFVMAGLVLYVMGRLLTSNLDTYKRGYILMFAAIGLFTPVAALSKENGALLPFFAFVLELTLLRGLMDAKGNKIRLYASWSILFGVPLLILVSYFTINWDNKIILQYLSRRDFNLSERLMTEGRIIWDYVGKIFIPRMQSSGLYYDNYQYSTGLLNPVQTLPALVALGVVLFAALKYRKAVPAISCGILFFLVGHIVESTFIPLELYFEHRNYLPSTFLFLPLALGVYYIYNHNKKSISVFVAAVVLLMLGGLTYARASLWGDIEKMALIWVDENPGSLRTQQQAAIMWSNKGHFERALKHTNKAIEYHPEKLISYLNKMSLLCALNREISVVELDKAIDLAAEKGISRYSIKSAEFLVKVKSNAQCDNVEYDEIIKILESAINSNKIKATSGNTQHLYYLLSRIYFLQDNKEKSRESLVNAYQANPGSIDSGMQIVGTLATYGFFETALGILNKIEKDNNRSNSILDLDREKIIRMSRDFSSEIERIRENIKRDMRNNQNTES